MEETPGKQRQRRPPQHPSPKHTSDPVSQTGGMKQKGIISYGIAPNRQYPLAGAAHDAVFNTWRRFSAQVLYWAPPMIAGYYILNWAIDRYALISPILS